MNLYDLLWDAVKGGGVEAFKQFIAELKGEDHISERLSLLGFNVDELSKETLRRIPLPVRFVAFLEELLSALVVEAVRIEVHIPYECSLLEGFLEDRLEVVLALRRDLIQEKHEYKLDNSFISKSSMLAELCVNLYKSLLSMCRS